MKRKYGKNQQLAVDYDWCRKVKDVYRKALVRIAELEFVDEDDAAKIARKALETK